MSYINLITGSSSSRCIMKHPKNTDNVDVAAHSTLNISATTSPGAKLNTLVNEAVAFIKNSKDTVIVYFMAGIPDITQRVVRAGRYNSFLGIYEEKYEEMLFTDSFLSSVNTYVNKLLDPIEKRRYSNLKAQFEVLKAMGEYDYLHKYLRYHSTLSISFYFYSSSFVLVFFYSYLILF